MDIRVLEYFLAVAREQSITKGADYLHLTQPTLSRQLKELEDELGKQLFIRGRRVTLTEEGMLLKKRAAEIVELMHKTEEELKNTDDNIAGDVSIGAGETDVVRILARAAEQMRMEHPDVTFHITSGDSIDILEKIEKGLIDLGLLFGSIDTEKFDYFRLPDSMCDRWGVLMRRDSPLAGQEAIAPEDLYDKPLLVSRQITNYQELTEWFRRDYSKLNIAASYNLIFNASLMVEEGVGYAITLDKLIHTDETSPLCFRPLSPNLTIGMSIVWKKYQVFPKAVETFHRFLREELGEL